MLFAACLALASSSHAPCWPYSACPPFPTPFPGNDSYPGLSYTNYTGAFPKGFAWGLGTAAYQIEGAYNTDGRGASIWDTFTGANTVGMPGSICTTAPCAINPHQWAKGATGNVANDHYHRWKADIAQMVDIGLKNYRFSISWPRVVPLGDARVPGGVNAKALAFYSDLIDGLLAAGITPVVTLYHWDLPQALMTPPYATPSTMGWYASDAATGKPAGQTTIVPLFAAFADLCFKTFGDRVKTWITFNEAWTFTWLASGGGKAPSIPEFAEMPKWPLIAGHNVLLAHAAVVNLYRTSYSPTQKGEIGITNNIDWMEPNDTSNASIAAAQRGLEFQLGWFADPIFGPNGDYPPSMRTILGPLLPTFTAAESALLKGSADFFGLNSYGSGWATDSPNAGFSGAYVNIDHDAGPNGPAMPRAQSIWLFGCPWGIRKLVNWVAKRYASGPLGPRVPILITEGGWSIGANDSGTGTRDLARAYYFANYTQQLQRAIVEDGVNLIGYFAWSLMDNFEWERGYTERFGVVYNEFDFGPDPNSPPGWAQTPRADAQQRTRKDSSRYLQEVWRQNRVLDPAHYAKEAGVCPPPPAAPFPAASDLPNCSVFPDPFLRSNGTRISNLIEWKEHRASTVALLEHYMYGTPPPRPPVRSTLRGTATVRKYCDRVSCVSLDSPATLRNYTLRVGPNASTLIPFDVFVYIPTASATTIKTTTTTTTTTTWPIVVYNGEGFDSGVEYGDLTAPGGAMLLNRGYAIAVFNRNELRKDSKTAGGCGEPGCGMGAPDGVQLLYPEYSDWSTIGVWAWGAAVVVDFLLADARLSLLLDHGKVSSMGHSRGGKTALWHGATDERVAITFPLMSGTGGCGALRVSTPITKGEDGESQSVRNINREFPYWFTQRYHNFSREESADGDAQSNAPWDQHFQRMLVAPRAQFGFEGIGNEHENPVGSQATFHAAKVIYDWLNVSSKIGVFFHLCGHPMNDNTSRCDGSHEHDWKVVADFADFIHFHKQPANTSLFNTTAYATHAPYSWAAPTTPPA